MTVDEKALVDQVGRLLAAGWRGNPHMSGDDRNFMTSSMRRRNDDKARDVVEFVRAALEAAKPAPEPAPSSGAVEAVRKAVKSAIVTCHDKGYGIAMSANAEEAFVNALLTVSLSPAPTSGSEAGGERPYGEVMDELDHAYRLAQETPEGGAISSAELIRRCGGDPDAPFERGPFPPEMRQFPPPEDNAGRDVLSPSMALLVKRLLEPPFGTETSERLLMGTAADAIRHLAKQETDIRAAYCLQRAENAQLVRENIWLDREWEAEQAEVARLKAALANPAPAAGDVREAAIKQIILEAMEDLRVDIHFDIDGKDQAADWAAAKIAALSARAAQGETR